MKFLRANPEAPIGLKRLPGNSNYFIGKDSRKWLTGVPQYGKVAFRRIYPGIDLVYYGNSGRLEYDFIVAPGADPEVVRFRIAGADRMTIGSSGGLSLQFDGSSLDLGRPNVYQEISGSRRTIEGNYILFGDGEVGLKLGSYDRRLLLMIDPVLSYSTLLPESNGVQVQAIAVDPAGNAYIAGTAARIPSPQSPNQGPTTLVVTKLNSAGNQVLYSTYLGASGYDTARAIAVDADGDAYITGNPQSPDFPTTTGAFMNACPSICNTPFVVKTLPDGSLGFSTFTGPSNAAAWAIAIDSDGASYIAGTIASNDLPVVNAFQPNFPGQLCTSCEEAFVQKLNPEGSALVYSTYFGGTGFANVPQTFGRGIAVDSAGSAYLVGSSSAIPTKNPLQASGLGFNAFITKFSPDGDSLVYSTYLGGSSAFFFGEGGDFATAVNVDSFGNAHVTGTSSSCDFPLSLDAFSTDCVSQGYDQKVFVTTLNAAGNRILFSTFLRSGFSAGLAVDRWGNTYVAGNTTSSNVPLVRAIDNSPSAGTSAFVSELDLHGRILFSTYFGGTSGTQVSGIAVDGRRAIYVAGTGSGDFPVLIPLPDSINGNFGYPGYSQGFVAKISSRSHPQLTLSPRSSPLLSLRNMSSVPVDIESIMPSATFIQQGGDCGVHLGPGAGCTLVLEGAADGQTTGTVSIKSSASRTPQEFEVAKSPRGDSVAQVVSVAPLMLQFGPELIGTKSPVSQVVLRNVGLQPAAVGGIGISGDFSQTNDCPALLVPPSYCTISVAYQPTAPGTSYGQLNIRHDPMGDVVYLNGTGSSSAIHASLPELQFGTQPVGAPLLPRIVNLTNATPYPASVTDISTTAGFRQFNTCMLPLPPQASCRVAVVYTPRANGTSTGALRAGGFGPGGVQTVNLSATGMTPGDLTLSPLELDFEGARVGYASALAVALTNVSQRPLSIRAIHVSTPFSETNDCPPALGPGGSCQAIVSFTPQAGGPVTGSLRVSFTGNGSPQVISLRGDAQASLQLIPASLSFGQQQVNTPSTPMALSLANFGSAPVSVTSTTVQGSDFSISYNPCGPTLGTFIGCGLQIVFTPVATGIRTGSVTFLTSESTQPYVAPLQGIGVGAGQAQLTPASLTFAPQSIGTTSDPQTITLTNTGLASLALGRITAAPSFFNATTTCGSSLVPGASCTVTVSFSPRLAGILVGTLTINDDAAGNPHAVALTGIGQ